MTKRLKTCLLLFHLVFGFMQAKDIYVAKNGKNTNNGTFGAPYLTISKAASIANAGDVVIIRGGTYWETVTPKNSGSPGNPIIFKSYQNEKVIVSAMQLLDNWTADGNGIWKTTVNWDLGQRNFVVNGSTVLDLARWPNNTDANRFSLNSVRNEPPNASANKALYGGSQDGVDKNAFLLNPFIPNWNWADGGSLLFYGDRQGSGWSTWKAKIKSSSNGRINFDANKNVPWIMNFHPPGDYGDFYLEGIKQALDYQNEWYFNAKTKTLFVKLPGNAKPKPWAVQMAKRELCFNLEGKNNIHIQNLATFGGSIVIKGNGNKVSGCTVFYGSMTRGISPGINTGVNAIFIKSNSYNTVIERSEIAYGDGSGVWDSGRNTFIKNNYIHDFGYSGMYDGPVMARGGGSNTKVLQNRIDKGGRDALQITNPGSEVAWNNISNSNLISDDCALLYTIGKGLNMKIHHNWFHDAQGRGKLKKAAGIYLDNDSENVQIFRNVVWNVEWTAVQINWNGTNIDIFNNTFVKAQGGTMGAWHKPGTQFSNVKVWNNITDKYAVNNQGNQETETTWEPQSNKQNNLVNNTSFVNFANNDFKLKSGSAAIDKGRVIQGITDGFKGNKPDVGAFELGDNWKAGPNWNISAGVDGKCYGIPGEGCTVTSTPAPPTDNNNDVFFIVNRQTGKKLRVGNKTDGSVLEMVPNEWSGEPTRWKKVNTSDGYFYLENVYSAMYFRPTGDEDGSTLIQRPSSYSGYYTQWKQILASDGYFYLQNRQTGDYFRPFGDDTFSKVIQRPTSYSGYYTQWKFVNTATARTSDGSKLSNEEIEVKENAFSLYPNPASDLLNIKTGPDSDYKVNILDVKGRLVKTFSIQKNTTKTISVSDLNSGFYILAYIAHLDGSVKSKKLIIK
ncbi:right-handed parallel beta-helix repeat-containing protein [Tamlana sp. 2_MG-2023]|uniref:T9SS type A sorting domain-containing protein n=1 Tax=unclassified Tamlana TaxID=2614803 RepID=UPI0026E30347|nr:MULTISPECIES: T9SS type A sorting domain-containing protein [unclassified Tamlana]MDO6760449.1 right-handed parallel beta-helix repeat-containing protein [Tamlana sp. 2_MG-2023]MDO6790705.1 right-handed parallel beta-helix repeat-containing protein [Tamlana sp. 1_MG-2023]